MKATTLKALVHGSLSALSLLEARSSQTKGRTLLLGACVGYHLQATFYHLFLEEEPNGETMSVPLSYAEKDALNYLYGGDDVEIECYSAAWVIISCSQKCASASHKDKRTQPPGTRMVVERAKVEGKFGSAYTCEACLYSACGELEKP